MSAPVDVLAVMDFEIRRREEAGAVDRSDRLQEARAAVAELMDQHARTLEVLEQARKNLESAALREKAKWPKHYLRTAALVCAEHGPKITAALSRCKGEAK